MLLYYSHSNTSADKNAIPNLHPGCTGISLTLVDKRKEGLIPFIEKKAGFKFERVGAPQPADMAKIAGRVLQP